MIESWSPPKMGRLTEIDVIPEGCKGRSYYGITCNYPLSRRHSIVTDARQFVLHADTDLTYAGRRIMMNQIGTMSAPRAIGWAAAAAGLFSTALFCITMPGFGFASFLAIAIAGALPIALVHAGFIAPLIARRVVGQRLVGWLNAVATGTLVAIGPATVCIMIEIPFSINEGRAIPVDDWLGALAILALAGVVGGFVFRALYGPRRLARKVGRK